jgi:hypothetical protein
MNDSVGMWMMVGFGIIIAFIAWCHGHSHGWAKGRSSAEDDENARKDGYRDLAHFLACHKSGNMVTPELAAHVRKNLENGKNYEARERAAGRLSPEQEARFKKSNEDTEKWLRDAEKNPYKWR